MSRLNYLVEKKNAKDWGFYPWTLSAEFLDEIENGQPRRVHLGSYRTKKLAERAKWIAEQRGQK